MRQIQNNAFTDLFFKIGATSLVVSGIIFCNNFLTAKFANDDFFTDYVLLNSYLFIALNLFTLGMTSAVVVYHRVAAEDLNMAASSLDSTGVLFLSAACSLGLLLMLVVSAIFVFLKYGVDQTAYVFSIGILALSQAQVQVLANYFQVLGALRAMCTLLITNALMSSVALWWCITEGQSINTFLYLYSLASLCFVIPFLACCLQPRQLTFKMVVPIFRFALPAAVTASVTSLLVTGDRILLDRWGDLQEITKYSHGVVSASVCLFLVNVFARTWGTRVVVSPLADVNRLSYFRSGEVKSLLFLILPILFIPFHFLYCKYIVGEYDPVIFWVSFALTAAYSTLGIGKYYLGFLNKYKRSNYILGILVVGALLFYGFALLLYSTLGLFSLPISLLFSSALIIHPLRSRVTLILKNDDAA